MQKSMFSLVPYKNGSSNGVYQQLYHSSKSNSLRDDLNYSTIYSRDLARRKQIEEEEEEEYSSSSKEDKYPEEERVKRKQMHSNLNKKSLNVLKDIYEKELRKYYSTLDKLADALHKKLISCDE